MTENANQNSLNVTQERIDELKGIKSENAKILDDISAQRTSLSKEKGDFETYKQEQNAKIDNARAILNREHGNALPMQEANDQISSLSAANETLTKENEDLKVQVSSLSAEVQSLKDHIAQSQQQ